MGAGQSIEEGDHHLRRLRARQHKSESKAATSSQELTSIYTDVAILGAGIAGAGLSLACAKEGLDNIVIEKGEVGSGSTSMSCGTLFYPGDMATNTPKDKYCRDSMHIIKQLHKEGYDLEFQQPGSLAIASSFSEAFYLFRNWISNIQHVSTSSLFISSSILFYIY